MPSMLVGFLLTFLPALAGASLLSVDLGSQYLKACLVRPGKPFEIVLNPHSKRKSPTVVSFHEEVRQFGDDAVSLQGKGPKKTIMYWPPLLGKNLSGVSSVSASDLGYHPKYYPYDIAVDAERKLPSFKLPGVETNLAIEEAAAHVIGFAKSIAEVTAEGADVREVVITVPSYAGQRHRRALMDAAEIAGFKKISLAHETSSAAVQRALDIVWDVNATKNSSTALFFNMGSLHTEVCVVRFFMIPTKDNKAISGLRMLGCSQSQRLGGHHVDLLIADRMLEAFKTKQPKLQEIEGSIRALKKLLVQAQAAKHVLSANKEVQFRVESLYEDTDFFSPIKRDELEAMAEKVFADVPTVIDEALKASNLEGGLASIDEIEVVGGGWRIPKVQQLISEHVNKDRADNKLDLGQHLNGDEAMAQGAAFMLANSSISFRVKKIFFTDVSAKDYTVVFTALDKNADEEAKEFSKEVNILPVGTPLTKFKKMRLTVTFDLVMDLYEDGNHLTKYTITGFNQSAFEKYAYLGKPATSITIGMDASGVVKVSNVEAIWKENVTEVVNETAAETPAENATEGADASSAEGENATEPTKKAPKKPKVKTYAHVANLTLEMEESLPLPMSEEEKKAAKERYQTMQEFDETEKKTQGLKNKLESFIYEARDLMENELAQKVSTEDVRSEVMSECTSLEEWMYEDGMTANLTQLEDKYKGLDDKVGPIKFRSKEYQMRPELAELVPQGMSYISKTLEYVKQNMSWVTDKDKDLVANMMSTFEEWYKNATEKQATLPLTETPAYQVNEVKATLSKVYHEAQRLTRIKYIPPMNYSDDYYARQYGNWSNYNWSNYNGTDPKFNYTAYREMFKNYSGNETPLNETEYYQRLRDYYASYAKYGSKGGAEGAKGEQGAKTEEGSPGADGETKSEEGKAEDASEAEKEAAKMATKERRLKQSKKSKAAPEGEKTEL